MPDPQVTVIIPTRNRRQLVMRAVDSVLRQDFQDFEIIVIDDGSTDGTDSALITQPRCRVLHTDHAGPAVARNAGIAQAAGQFLAFLDSDDYWQPHHLSRLIGLMTGPQVGLAYSPTQTAGLDGQPLRKRRDRRKCFAGQVIQPLFQHVFVHTSNIVCRTNLVRQAGGFDESLPVCEDYHLWLRVALRCEVACADEPTATRCWHGQALSRQDRLRNAVVRAAMLERFYLAQGGAGRHSATYRPSTTKPRCFFRPVVRLAAANQRADALKFFARSLRYRPVQVRGEHWLPALSSSPESGRPASSVQRLLDGLAWTV